MGEKAIMPQAATAGREWPRTVVHLMTTLLPNGAETHVFMLARQQVLAGIKVHIIYLKGAEGLAPRMLSMGAASVEKVDLEALGPLATIRTLKRRLRDLRPDVLHTHLLKANVLGGLAALGLRPRITVIASKHNDEHQLRNPAIAMIHGTLSRLCDHHVIALSDHVRDYMVKVGRIAPERISRVYYGFDHAFYDVKQPMDVRRAFDLPADSFVFGIVARITDQKGHLYLVDAFDRLLRDRPNARLLVVGEAGYDDTYKTKVVARIKELGRENEIRLVGRQDGYAVIGGLDCYVMPSLWEGFGMVFLEALWQSVPIISTRISAIPEVVRDGIDGLLVKPADVETLETAMREAMDRKASGDRPLGQDGPAAVRDRFMPERMLAETLAVYAKVRQA